MTKRMPREGEMWESRKLGIGGLVTDVNWRSKEVCLGQGSTAQFIPAGQFMDVTSGWRCVAPAKRKRLELPPGFPRPGAYYRHIESGRVILLISVRRNRVYYRSPDKADFMNVRPFLGPKAEWVETAQNP